MWIAAVAFFMIAAYSRAKSETVELFSSTSKSPLDGAASTCFVLFVLFVLVSFDLETVGLVALCFALLDFALLSVSGGFAKQSVAPNNGIRAEMAMYFLMLLGICLKEKPFQSTT